MDSADTLVLGSKNLKRIPCSGHERQGFRNHKFGRSMPSKSSVTRWINELKSGDAAAAALLWDFVKAKLTTLARRKTGNWATHDEDDVAHEAFTAFCDGLQTGQFDEVESRESLWKLLAVIAINRARNLARNENRHKRGGSLNRIEDGQPILDGALSEEATPEFSVAAQEEVRRLLNLLKTDELKIVAMLKVDGYTNEEIAKHVGCTRRSIQRRLKLIRDIWSNELK